jgi:hypothetical protein
MSAPRGLTHCYLHAMIRIRNGQMSFFVEHFRQILPFFTNTLDWKLVSAGQCLTGRPGWIFHLWTIPDPNSVLNARLLLAEHELYAKLAECVEEMTQEIMIALPYSESR